jgi:hypothetical protein
MPAITRAYAIAKALGKAQREGCSWRCLCPLHGGHSLSVGDGNTTLLVRCWAGCESNDVLAELRRLHLIEDRSGERRPIRPPPPRPDNENDRERRQHQKAAWLWSQSRPIAGTIAERYLREARAITCQLPPTLAFLPALNSEHSPAMIAAFALPREIEPGVLAAPDKVDAVHLTLLRPDGTGKAEVEHAKRFVGSPKNLPIVIAPPNDCLALAITEGIEDALTAHQATGFGAWAAGAGGRMAQLAETLPRYIETVIIFAHSDKTGQDGAFSAG